MRVLPVILLSITLLSAANTDGVIIGASVNGSVEAVVYRGWPAFIGVSMIHPRYGAEEASPVEIRSEKGWSSAVVFRLANADGGAADLPLLDNGNGNAQSAMVPVRGSLQARWIVDPDATTKLQPGKYRLQAGVVWGDGSARARTISISVEDEPAVLTQAQQSMKAYMWACYWAATDHRDKGQMVLDQHLAMYPKDVRALELRGDLCDPGDRYGATTFYVQALAASDELNSKGIERPVGLITKLNAAASAVLGGK